MTIWLINPYGPIPGETWRDYRFTLIAETLAAQGHQVTWWTAGFSHHFKRFRTRQWKDIVLSPAFRIRLVPTPGYRRHIGGGRLLFEAVFAARTYARGRAEEPPACVVATDPPQCVGWIAVALARHHRARLIIDVMDLWPELFALAFPRRLRRLAPLVLSPLYALRRRNLRHADALTALCETYLEVARRVAGHRPGVPARTIFNGADVGALRARSRSGSPPRALPEKRPGEVWAIYAGTLGHNYDIETLLEAAALLSRRGRHLRLLVAGDGPLRPRVLEYARGAARSITYLGQLAPEELAHCYGLSDLGVCAYSADSNVAMPDKAYDYLAAGLPIVSSLPGELARLVASRRLGVAYRAGDPLSLAEALGDLAADAEARANMSANCLALAPEFDRHRQYAQFVPLLEAVAGAGQPPAEIAAAPPPASTS